MHMTLPCYRMLAKNAKTITHSGLGLANLRTGKNYELTKNIIIMRVTYTMHSLVSIITF